MVGLPVMAVNVRYVAVARRRNYVMIMTSFHP